MKPEMRSHRTIMTMPIARKFGAPILLKKSEKYSIVSIILVSLRWQGERYQRAMERAPLF